MARKRMISPEIWQSEDFARLPLLGKLVFIGMFSHADDEGRGRAKAAYIKSVLFPYESGVKTGDVDRALDGIARHMSALFYKVDGNEYYQLTNWRVWQKVDKPTPSKLPPFGENAVPMRTGDCAANKARAGRMKAGEASPYPDAEGQGAAEHAGALRSGSHKGRTRNGPGSPCGDRRDDADVSDKVSAAKEPDGTGSATKDQGGEAKQDLEGVYNDFPHGGGISAAKRSGRALTAAERVLVGADDHGSVVAYVPDGNMDMREAGFAGDSPNGRRAAASNKKERKAKQQSGKEAAADGEPVVRLPLCDGTEYPILRSQADHWAELYPAVNVLQELRKMAGWCEAAPQKRKTRNNILLFVTGWLAREQDRGGASAPSEKKNPALNYPQRENAGY